MQSQKTLLIFFSRAGYNYGIKEKQEIGNTKIVAKIIKELINCDEYELIPKKEYPIESIVMFYDELGVEELPDFVKRDEEYVIEYVVQDITFKNQKELEMIVANFLDIESRVALGMALIKDNQLIATRKEGVKEWIF